MGAPQQQPTRVAQARGPVLGVRKGRGRAVALRQGARGVGGHGAVGDAHAHREIGATYRALDVAVLERVADVHAARVRARARQRGQLVVAALRVIVRLVCDQRGAQMRERVGLVGEGPSPPGVLREAVEHLVK